MEDKMNEPFVRSAPAKGLNVSVWQNRSEKGTYFSVSVRTHWRDKDGKLCEQKLRLSPEQLAALTVESTRLCHLMAASGHSAPVCQDETVHNELV